MLALVRPVLLLLFAASLIGSTGAAQENSATLRTEPGPTLRVTTTPMTRVAVVLATRLESSGKFLALDDFLLIATRDEPTLRGTTDDRGEVAFVVPIDPALAKLIPPVVFAQVARYSDGDRSPVPISPPYKVDLVSLAVTGTDTDRSLSRVIGIALLAIGASLTMSVLAPSRAKRTLLLVIAGAALMATPYFLFKSAHGRGALQNAADATARDRERLRLRFGDSKLAALKALDGLLPEGDTVVLIGNFTSSEVLLLKMTMPRHAVRAVSHVALAVDAPYDSPFVFLDREIEPPFKPTAAPTPLVVGRRSP